MSPATSPHLGVADRIARRLRARRRGATDCNSCSREHGVGCRGLLACDNRATSVKTRIVAHRQQVVRVDRETRGDVGWHENRRPPRRRRWRNRCNSADAVIVGDYAKGVITQPLAG